MRKTIKLAVVAALALGATSAFATNGSNLIGTGAKARGMGGVGIAMSHGAESGLANGALITKIEMNHEISFGGTLFMPKVTSNIGTGTSSESAANMSVIPEVSIANKVNDNFYWGVGMWGTAGMGVDHRDNSSNMKMVTNLQLMQFGVPLAYTTNGFSAAITPVLQYGSLDIDFLSASNRTQGVSQDLQFGYNLGLAYETSGITIGATYKSQIDMAYNKQISSAGTAFGLTLGDQLSTPAEIGLGVSYEMGEHTIALDYKQVKWGDAKGYKDFNWKDQSVVALGYEFSTNDYAARVGYNYAKSPIEEMGGSVAGGRATNTLNLLGFPAIIESHFTIGGTYNIDKMTSLDLAYAYAPEASETFAGTNGSTGADVTTKHSQTSLSFQLNYAF